MKGNDRAGAWERNEWIFIPFVPVEPRFKAAFQQGSKVGWLDNIHLKIKENHLLLKNDQSI
ncbi:MAG: hypothetical protein RBR20_09945 [Desulfobacterales bacterium]|nr:hypothetical protein [Desulfobacterales bacterium]